MCKWIRLTAASQQTTRAKRATDRDRERERVTPYLRETNALLLTAAAMLPASLGHVNRNSRC